VWNAITGDRVNTLTDHQGILEALAISPTGDRMVTLAQNDKNAYLWDIAAGKVVAVLQHIDAMSSASFSPDGRRVVTGSWDGAVRIWDSQTGQLYSNLSGHQKMVVSTAFSLDGKRLVTASVDHTARVWPIYETVQELVDASKVAMPRCLTIEQRTRYFLDPELPAWCQRLNKWPADQGS
jgi:WD40 repeat protein